MASMYKVKVGRQGRIVLPKALRQAYGINAGDEAIILTEGREISMHVHKVSEDPLQDLIELSKTVKIGFSAEELKQKADEERLKQYLER